MNRIALAAILSLLIASTAAAAGDLIKVPALCGTPAEVLGALSVKMPNPEEVGRGGDGQGSPMATLFVGNGYWALLAMMSPDSVCVVASGYNWTATAPADVRSF